MSNDPYTNIQNTAAELRRLEMEMEAQTGRMMSPSYEDSVSFPQPSYELAPVEKRKRRHPILFYTALILLACSLLVVLLNLAAPSLIIMAFTLRSILFSVAAIAIPFLLLVVLLLSR